MKRSFVFSVPEAEAIRLFHILSDKDEKAALAFLEEHARKPLHRFIDGG